MNVFTLPNVSIHPEKRAEFQNNFGTEMPIATAVLEPLIIRIANKYPLWQVYGSGYNARAVFNKFIVVSKDETLGYISQDYVGNTWKFLIGNDRIDNARERGRGYRTNDLDKAMAKIKKMFGRKTVTERVSAATELSNRIIYDLNTSAERGVYDKSKAVDNEMYKFVREPHIYEMFVAYAQKLDATRNLLDSYEQAKAHMMTTKDLREKYSKNETTLVIRDDDEYIVKTNQGVKIYMDYDLPNTLRGKIGMLKLVEPNAVIDNIGVKLHDDIFVLTPDNE